jgi:hypothetical protein
MKKLFILSVACLTSTLSFAQHRLTSNHNRMRPGDKILKQQVEYKDEGRSGENVLWDFGKLKSVNPEYSVSYFAPKLSPEDTYIMGLDTFPAKNIHPEELIIGYEHFTAYYYRFKDSCLYLTGHANAVSQMRHEKPVLIAKYPVSYGGNIRDNYQSLTLYAGAKPFNSRGDITVEADASGMMMLPDGDTLRNVMRIKTIRTITEIPDTTINDKRPNKKRKEPTPPMNTRIESYVWYAEGYRYPVFETIRHFDENDSINSEFFATAFFYPPQEHYYLDDDPENQAVLDNAGESNAAPLSPEQWIKKNFTYNFNPNPVSHLLNIEYRLEEATEVGIKLSHSATGIAANIPVGFKQKGSYTETINCASLPVGTYVLSFLVHGQIVSNVILKK